MLCREKSSLQIPGTCVTPINDIRGMSHKYLNALNLC